MSKGKWNTAVAVGLVFSAGGHQLVLERDGVAQAADAEPFFVQSQASDQVCEAEPASSGFCFAQRSDDPITPEAFPLFRDQGSEARLPSKNSDGSSGMLNLPIGTSRD